MEIKYKKLMDKFARQWNNDTKESKSSSNDSDKVKTKESKN